MKYFSVKEFEESNTAKKQGIVNKAGAKEAENIKTLVRELLDPLRERFGRIKLNSGFRNDELNKAVGGVPTSHHRSGQAADCVFIESDYNNIWKELKVGGYDFTQAIWYRKRGFIHLSYVEGDLRNQMIVK